MTKNVLVLENNFEKIKGMQSKMLYGRYDEDADFTISIPIYGCGKFFKDTLVSLKNMNKTDIKLQIVVSNNKPESDQDVINVLKCFPSLNLVYFNTEETLGSLNNFNRAIELAKTDYVGMIHDDDLIVQNYMQILKKIIPFLRKNNKIGMISSGKKFFYSSHYKCDEIVDCKKVCLKRISKPCITHYGTTLTGIPSCGFLFNRKAFIDNGGFNFDYPSSGDAFLAAIMIESGYKIYSFETLTGYYRVFDNDSLNLNICKGFIIEDDMFYNSWSKKNFFRKVHYLIFSRYIYSQSIDQKVNMFSRKNEQINTKSLDYKNQYKYYKKTSITRILFRIEGIIIELFRKTFKRRIK